MSRLIGARRALYRAPAVVEEAAAAATTWNNADKSSANLALSNSDRTVTYTPTNNTNEGIRSVHQHSVNQKVYIENVATNFATAIAIGFATGAANFNGFSPMFGSPTKAAGVSNSGQLFCADSPDDTLSLIASIADGDRIGVAFNTATGKLWARKNGGTWNSAIGGGAGQDPAAGTGGVSVVLDASPVYAWVGMDANTGDVFTTNFDSAHWVDVAPTGFTAITA